ncbi:MAG: Maf family protein [Pseudomonadota bacterium]
MKRLILASASPRRTSILRGLDVSHDVAAADIDESKHANETPEHYALRMAREKALCVQSRIGDDNMAVMGADTVVSLDGVVFGKPANEAEAVAALTALGGREHRVISALALACGRDLATRVVASTVRMRPIADAEAKSYWATGEPTDKAGGYAIQGRAAAFVESIDGSYSGIVGLPAYESLALLATVGITPGWLSGANHG